MAENQFEKTEAPTPRRLQEARDDGNIARSTDLTAAGMLLAGIVVLNVFGTYLLEGIGNATIVLLAMVAAFGAVGLSGASDLAHMREALAKIGRASCRERV